MNEHTIKEALLKGERLTMECKRCENKITQKDSQVDSGGKIGGNVVVDAVAEKLTERQRLIMKIIKESAANVADNVADNVAVNTKYLSERLNVNRKTIQRDLVGLQELKLIRWVGPDNGGHWEIIDN